MAFIGGDIKEVKYNHSTVGNGVFYPKANEDSTFDLGGVRNADDANMVTGAGQAIRQMNQVRWSVEATCAADENSAKDIEKINDLAASPVDATWTITHVNGTVWTGTGHPVGDLQYNGNAATFTLKISGGGKLKQI